MSESAPIPVDQRRYDMLVKTFGPEDTERGLAALEAQGKVKIEKGGSDDKNRNIG